MDNPDHPLPGNAVDAMRVLLEAGVSNATLGQALRDLLLPQPTGAPVLPLPPPSIAARGFEVAGNGDIHRSMPFKVRLRDGTVTNVTLPANLFQALVDRVGSDDGARKRIRYAARETPPETANRSKHVQNLILDLLLNSQPSPGQI